MVQLMQRKIKQIFEEKSTLEGAGVRLKRVFGYHQIPLFDPFLLLDHFGSSNPADYIKGFPWHPHRGIETVTYILTGQVEHGDSIGNKGIIKSGDVQWMTAGSGIIHQEMPKRYNGLMQGFQLWVNLPARSKMIEPRYRGITGKDIPEIEKNGKIVKVIAGKFDSIQGPIKDLRVDVEYFDISLEKSTLFRYSTKNHYKTSVYLIEGSGYFNKSLINEKRCILFEKGDYIEVKSKDNLRFLLISGEPLNEPVAWGGPIVMNYQEELDKAFQELEEGMFIKQKTKVNPSKHFYKD